MFLLALALVAASNWAFLDSNLFLILER